MLQNDSENYHITILFLARKNTHFLRWKWVDTSFLLWYQLHFTKMIINFGTWFWILPNTKKLRQRYFYDTFIFSNTRSVLRVKYICIERGFYRYWCDVTVFHMVSINLAHGIWHTEGIITKRSGKSDIPEHIFYLLLIYTPI